MKTQKSLLPTRKWLAAQAVLLGGIFINAVDTGWSDVETKAIILWAIQAVTTYLVPNEQTPGGVPRKEVGAGERGQYDPVYLLVVLVIVILVVWLVLHLVA